MVAICQCFAPFGWDTRRAFIQYITMLHCTHFDKFISIYEVSAGTFAS